MVTLEQKLSLFSKLLQQDVNNEIGEKIQKMEKEYEEMMADHKHQVDREARHIVERAEKKAEEKRLELLSKARMQTKKQSMVVKEKYIGTFIQKLEQRFRTFAATEGYKVYLEHLLKQLKGLNKSSEYVVYMVANDLEHYGEWVKAYLVQLGLEANSITCQEKNTHLIGGFILECPKENSRFDLSVYTLIEENKEYIIEHVFSAVGEVGESNES